MLQSPMKSDSNQEILEKLLVLLGVFLYIQALANFTFPPHSDINSTLEIELKDQGTRILYFCFNASMCLFSH